MKRPGVLIWALTIMMIFIESVYPQVKDVKAEAKLDQMSLDELLNICVIVAGNRPQKISEAPAIVSVITAQEIREMGFSNLYEILSFVPGINITETYYGSTMINCRGQLQTHYNNKSLLLLNNHPLFDSTYGNYFLEQIPIDIIKRIEIIRGPGSVLYGTNAYSGVIKIITKSPHEMNGGKVSFATGSFNTISPTFTFGKDYKDFSLAASISLVDSKGWPFKLDRDEEGRSGSLNYENDYLNGMISLKYKKLTSNFCFFNSSRDKMGIIGTFASTGKRDFTGFSGDISLPVISGKKLSLNVYGNFDSIKRKELFDWYPPFEGLKELGIGEKEEMKSNGSKTGVEIQGLYNLGEKVRFTGGISYEYLYTAPQIFYKYGTDIISPFGSSTYLESHTSYDIAGYLQVEADITKQIGAIVGMRYTRNKIYGSKFVPRMGIILKTNDKLALKILYGEAFRNPYFFEKYVDTKNVLYGDENLLPEHIKTLDIGIDFLFSPKNSLRVNVFFTSTKDEITRDIILELGSNGQNINIARYVNGKGNNYQGIEGEIKGSFVKNLEYQANVSWVTGIKHDLDNTIEFIPEFSMNYGFNWEIDRNLSLNNILQYIGPREGILTDNTKFKTAGYTLINSILSYRPSDSVILQLEGKNLLNTHYFHPEYIRSVIPQIPGGPGRTIYFKIIYYF